MIELAAHEVEALNAAARHGSEETFANWPAVAAVLRRLGWGGDQVPDAIGVEVHMALAHIVADIVADVALGRTHWSGCAPTSPCCRCRAELAEAALASRPGPARH